MDPAEIRRIAEARGYFPGQGKAVPLNKDGARLAEFGGACVLMLDVGPELAQLWLKNNFRNRPIREDTVKAYARDMLTGSWVPTHQGIAFNDRDELIDGQHRLHAVILAKATVRMMVTFGLPSKIDGKEMTTMDAVDRGATRSVGDQLAIQHGIRYGSTTASICAAIASICFGERTRRLSVGQTLEVYRAFEHCVDYVIENKSKAVGLRSTGVLAGFAFAMAAAGDDRTIIAHFTNLNTGENLKAGSPIGALRNFLTSPEARLITRSLDRGLAELVLRALQLELEGKTVDKLEMNLEGAEHFKNLQRATVDKIAGIFTLPKAVTAPAPAPPAARAASEAANGSGTLPPSRPSVERILEAVEAHFKISRHIILGRGTDPEVTLARSMVVDLAHPFGHTWQAIAHVIKRRGSESRMANYFTARQYMIGKQAKTYDTIRAKLMGGAPRT